MNARRKKGRRIFETFSSQGPSEFLEVSRARWDEYHRLLVTQEEKSRRKAQELECGVSQSWAAVYQSIARRMLSYLDNSEAFQMSTGELKEQVLCSNEPSVAIERVVRQARSEKDKKLFQIFSRHGAKESGNAWTFMKQLGI